MKVSRKQIALIISLCIFSIIVVHVSGDRPKFRESRSVILPPEVILDENCYPVLSANGKVGFIASVTSGSAMSFSTSTGRVMSSIIIGETIGAISLVETHSRRLLVVPAANDPDNGRPASIAIIDASKPKELQIATLTILPKTAHITPSTRAFLTADARFGLIASSFPEPTLYSFSTETGQILSQLAIIGQPSKIAVRNLGATNLIAIASSAVNGLSLINLDANGQLHQLSFFSPNQARIGDANNPEISINGRIAYIAASEGGMVFAVDVMSGTLINSLNVSSAPQRISLSRNQNREELIAVTHIRSNTNNQASGVLIAISSRGHLKAKSNFEPPEQIEFSSVNNVVFSDDAATAYVGAKSGMLFAFNTETGELQGHQTLGSELLSIALSNTAQKVIAIKRSSSRDEITITDFEILSGDETDSKLKSGDQVTHNLSASDSSNISRNVGNSSNGKAFSSKETLKVFLRDANGKQNAVESSKVRFRSSKTLEIALDGKLTELIERGGWKFNVRSDETNLVNQKISPQINRALVKPSKNDPNILRLKIVGANYQDGDVIEFIKAGAVIYKQVVEFINSNELMVKIPKNKYVFLGRFSVRIINNNQLTSNLIEVEPYNNNLSDALDSRLVNKVNVPTTNSVTVVELVSYRTINNGVQIFVKTNTQVHYSDFTLSNPSRIVVDVSSAQNAFGYKTLNINSSSISRVRVGQPSEGIVRIVLDTYKNTPYKVNRESSHLIITVGDAALDSTN